MHITKAIISLVFFFNTPQFTEFSLAVKKGRQRFFAHNHVVNLTFDYTANDFSVGILEMTLSIVEKWTNYFTVSIVYGVLPITYWLAAKELQEFVYKVSLATKKSPKGVNKCEKVIIEMHESLKSLTGFINGIWSTTSLLHVIEISLEMIELHGVIKTRDPALISYYSMEITFTVVSLVFMAEGSRAVSTLLHYLQ